MSTLVRAAVAVVVLCGIMNGSGGAIVNAGESKGDAIDHASVRAYPNAVVSATDPGSGITVSVERDGTSVTARSATGTILWHADVLKETGRPNMGFPVVRDMHFTAHGSVWLAAGKHRYIEVDLTNGKIMRWGED